ncbi:MAG: hypothetical protein M1826_007576 [Phylliscum demangeonii]|nr:MAG: hypothetical protein M1826_007576 [Phylliscum demangeonii]
MEILRDNRRAQAEYPLWSEMTDISTDPKVRHNYAVRWARHVGPKQDIYRLYKDIEDPFAEEGDNLDPGPGPGPGPGTPPAAQANGDQSTPPPPPSSAGPNPNSNAFALHSLSTKPAPLHHLQLRPSFGARLWQFSRHQVQQVHRGVGGLARSWHLLPQTRSASSSAAAAVKPGPVRSLLLHPE